jgi:glucose/arabinose dehydrogenase
MDRKLFSLIMLALCACAPASDGAQSDSGQMASEAMARGTAQHDYRLETVAEGLERPWSVATLPGGDVLITEKPGRLRIVRNGALLPNPVAGVPEVVAEGQGGLFDVLPHPEFATNRMLYLSFSKPLEGGESTTAVVRARFENDALSDVEEIFEADSRGRGHYGARMAFAPDGHLFVTVGDRQAPPTGDLEMHPAQDLSNHHGTVNRLNDDGTIPEDNPFVGRDGIPGSIYSYGHRNEQGLAIGADGSVWITEHGPQGGDELNLVVAGANYGWPVVGRGLNYGEGTPIHSTITREGTEQPAHFWVPSIATSGLMVYDGDAFPEWRGDIFAGGLAGEVVARLEMQGDRVIVEEPVLYGMGRVRDVRQGLDGYIYVAIEDRDGGPTAVYRMVPALDS